ncbi:MAG: hypothetical protein EBR99_02300 [Actinobacteria bacterium]|nr:hypothetical protein [Actinomycetota bacterium]
MTDINTMGREAAAKVREFAATNSAAKKAKDAIYTIVGLGVIGAQKINVAAKAARTKVDETVDTEGLNAAVKSNTADITSAVKRTAANVDAKVNEVIAKAEAIVLPYEEKLPAATREVASKVRAMSTAARTKVTEALNDEVVVEAPVVADESETTPA